MSENDAEFDFDEYDKPGAERSRRRRGEDDDIESDLEEELLGDDGWTSNKKLSEMSDEELNDDLLQSDDEDQNIGMGTSYGQQAEEGYTDDTVTQGAPGYEEEGEYSEDYSQDHNAHQMDYSGDPAQDDENYQDEVLDLEINEPLDSEFQDEEYTTSYKEKPLNAHHDHVSKAPEEEFVEDEVSSTAESSKVESEAVLEKESREESEEEDEEDEESGRLRFKSERKEGVTVRLADAGRKRSNIPETLELSEKAKADLKEFEEQEEKRRQSRYGRGRGGRGGRGRGGMLGYGPQEMRGNRRRMNEPRYPFIGNMNMQHQGSRMPPHQQHHPRPRGPPPFSELGRPLVQQPLQPLMPPHMSHRSPQMHSQMEPPPRMMSLSPPGFPQHSHPQAPPPQPKNIHINPHFRGPSAPVQVPLMPPAQSQPRPAVGPPRFPAQGDFPQHTFGAPQRPPPHMEPYRNQPPLGPQDREPLFMGDHGDSAPFPGQPIFEHHGPSPLMNTNIHPHQLPGPGHMGFGPPGPTFNQPGHGPLGLFQREPPRPGLPSNHVQGMLGMNQGGPPNQPRQFMGPRQPFGQPRNHFHLPVQYRMQPPHPQDLAHPPQAAHAQHHHQQQPPNEPRPMMHSGQNSFHPQQAHGSPRQSTPRSQNPQLRNMANRQRTATPTPKQGQSLPQRNSNLREVPVATGNTNMNSIRPATAASANPTSRPSQSTTLSNRGRGQASARGQAGARGRGASQPGGPGRPEPHKNTSTQSDTGIQNAEEDEETRQYRMKIEEQKRLREEILKRKEMRRQMQAGVRKKELLDRLNPQSQNQGTAPAQNLPSQPHPPVQQPPPQQRAMPPSQQPPNQITPFSPNGSSKAPRMGPPMRTRGPMVMGTNQHPQPNVLSSEPPHTQTLPLPSLQQRRSTGLHNAARAPSSVQPPAPRPGAKRTVMQRATDPAPTPHKVRLIKLSGAGEKGSSVTGVPLKEECIQSTSPHNLGAQRKFTMAAQQQQGSNVPQQQNRVVVSGRGRGRGQAGAGRPPANRQNQKAAENGPATVSIEGLSSSTTEVQLKNLLKSIGPIEMFKMLPQDRKAIARFSSPQHAASFQSSFHRHMIDLSHIDVSLIDG